LEGSAPANRQEKANLTAKGAEILEGIALSTLDETAIEEQ